jgi:GDP-L-fucose synthase
MKIIVTGGSGMVGRSLKKYLPSATYISSKDYNLTLREGIQSMLIKESPDVIIHLAAKVGGITDNIDKPVEYFEDNLLMNTQLVKYSYLSGVKRFIGILSTCIYPDIVSSYPIPESMLHMGPPTKTNFSYGYAKRALAVQIEAYNQQYGTQYQYLTPCNLYGEFDKYGDNSHFIAALIKKIHIAKLNKDNKIILFGDGTPLRQFMYSDDLAYVIKCCLENEIYDSMNVAVDENLSIIEMAHIALKACGAEYLDIEFDINKPNGQYRKDVSVDLLKQRIPSFNPIKLEDGIKQTYNYLIKNNILQNEIKS